MKSEDIDHELTDELVCPFCGYEHSDSWELSPSDEELGLLECGNCDKFFYGTRNISVSYSTEKANYGNCKHCNKVDVPIENYTSNIGKYADLCVDCGSAEKHRLMVTYIENLSLPKAIESNE